MSRIGLKLGLAYWGAVGFQVSRAGGPAPGSSLYEQECLQGDVAQKVAEKASELSTAYSCTGEVAVVMAGSYHAKNGPWLLFRFSSYDIDGATFAADALRKYVGRFKSTTNVPLEEAINWQGKPLE